jgi:GNAT superfamily N-acetyltransferase
VIHAGLGLARRLEAAEAASGAGCVEAHRLLHPESGATFQLVAGGCAIFVGPGSPLTHAVGLGMRGAVRPEELDRLEAFYRTRGAEISVDLCPLADPSLVELLADRGYRLVEFSNVLVRPLAIAETGPPETSVRLANPDEEELWAHTVGHGFLEKDVLTADEMDVGRTIVHMPGSLCYLAFSGSQPAAAGALTMRGGLATLFADSTVPAFRGAGLQPALIRERLRAATAHACDLAMASTQPGSVSQRNYERNGFQVAYTKATLAR